MAKNAKKITKKAKIKVKKPEEQHEKILLAAQKNLEMIYSPKQAQRSR
jgi:hypothetical protein